MICRKWVVLNKRAQRVLFMALGLSHHPMIDGWFGLIWSGSRDSLLTWPWENRNGSPKDVLQVRPPDQPIAGLAAAIAGLKAAWVPQLLGTRWCPGFSSPWWELFLFKTRAEFGPACEDRNGAAQQLNVFNSWKLIIDPSRLSTSALLVFSYQLG